MLFPVTSGYMSIWDSLVHVHANSNMKMFTEWNILLKTKTWLPYYKFSDHLEAIGDVQK